MGGSRELRRGARLRASFGIFDENNPPYRRPMAPSEVQALAESICVRDQPSRFGIVRMSMVDLDSAWVPSSLGSSLQPGVSESISWQLSLLEFLFND